MDDAVNQRSAPVPIPVLSPTLHCVAMTALVYLRSSFGFTFLRPKSVFFAFSWAFVLLLIVAWNEPEIWREYRAAFLFGAGAILLYWTHFFITFGREWRKKADEDHYPGTSHTILVLRFLKLPKVSEEILHFWVEPGFVLLISATLRVVFNERHLSGWLFFVALCLVGREAINHWTSVRRTKVAGETLRKVQQQGEALAEDRPSTPPPKAVRKEQVKRKRNAPADGGAEETRFAELLRLRPPYSLEKAEENFRTLIRLEHPDANENSQESNEAAVKLNEAIEFFRNKLREG